MKMIGFHRAFLLGLLLPSIRGEDGCREGDCRDPATGECVGVVSCLTDPCRAADCGAESCEANYCGRCRAVCADGSLATLVSPIPAPLGGACDAARAGACGEGAFCRLDDDDNNNNACDAPEGTCAPTGLACIASWDPVCGCDGETYSNECAAHSAGVSVSYAGECGKAAPTVSIAVGDECKYGPDACGKGAFCRLDAGVCGESNAPKGACSVTPEFCDKKLEWVCGCDGETYSNECMAYSAGVSISYKGECKAGPASNAEPVSVALGGACEGEQDDSCGDGAFCQLETGQCKAPEGTCAPTGLACIASWDPVCGCDGETYSNECAAHSAGVSVSYAGECDKAAPTVSIVGAPTPTVSIVGGPGDGCREGDCRDPVTGECAGVVSCLADPCQVTEDCSPESCEANYCGGCHAVCREGLGVPAALGGECQSGPAADEAFSCAKGSFCQLEEGACNSKAGIHFGRCAAAGGPCPPVAAPAPDPVCGCDGETYPDECHARSAGVSVSRAGACEAAPTKPAEPVALGGACDAEQSNACGEGAFCRLETGECDESDAPRGACSATPELCDTQYEPVCGCDGETYSNECDAHSKGVSVSYKGECRKTSPTVSIVGGPVDGCREGDCRDPITGECAGVVSCLADPCQVTEDCSPESCEANYCGGCHAVCKEDPGVPVAAPTVSIAIGDECKYGPVDACGKGAFCRLETGTCDESDAPKGACSIAPRFCDKKLEPVCGCDGETYSNECTAYEQGVSLSYAGECEADGPPGPPAATVDAIDPAQHQMFADELTSKIYFNANECSSALGVSMAFSLIYPGSTRAGLGEVRDTFYFPFNNMQLVWEETTQRMLANADGEDLGYAVAPLLRIANSVWFDEESTLDKGYQSVVGDYAMQTEFEDDGSPYVVNEWVSESTNGLIDSIVPEDKPLFPPYVLIAINSIYLKATWGLQFEKRRTNLDSFYDSFSRTNEVSEAHFMHMVEYFDYSHEAMPGYQVINLPFKASEMSMIFVLPLSDDSEAVSSSALIAALDDLRRTRVALALPKFNFESEYDEVLRDGLFEMGVEAPFTEGAAALCGLFEDKTGCEDIYLGKVVQKTVIDVNEEGVEAAAVTALGAVATSVPTDNPVAVVLDHPFQFFVYDASEGVVLFEGRVGAPEAPEGEPAVPLMESKHSDRGFWLNNFGVVSVPPPAYVAGKGESVASPAPPAEGIDPAEAVGGGESDVSPTPPVEAVDPTEAAGPSDTTQPAEAAGSSTTQPTEAAGTSTTQSTEAAGESTTQSTEAAGESNTATGPTEPAPIDPDPSSGNISSNRSFSLCACVLLALHLVFAG